MTIPGDSSAHGPTATGLPANVAGALAYALGPFTGLLFYILEKDNAFVRFHAAQSMAVSLVMLVVSVALGMLGAVLSVIPILGALVAMLLSLALWIANFALWLFLMWQAYKGLKWEAPFAGAFARRML